MSTKMSRIAAIVLAAGYSSRIGRPKALLPLGGSTCLGLVLDTCRGANIGSVQLVVGHRGGEISAAARDPEVTVVWNDRYPSGQLSSFQAGIRALPDGLAGVLAFPVDYPLVQTETLLRLVRAFREEREGKTLFLPTCAGVRGHPYLIATLILPEYLALPEGAMGRTVVLADAARVREVPVEDDGILLDLDTPDDYLEIRARVRR